MERLIPKPSSAAPRCKFRQIKAANEHEASLLSQISGFYKEQRNLFSLPRLRLKYDVILLPQSWFGSSRNQFFIWAEPFFPGVSVWCLRSIVRLVRNSEWAWSMQKSRNMVSFSSRWKLEEIRSQTLESQTLLRPIAVLHAAKYR